jgi:hypothetical protein
MKRPFPWAFHCLVLAGLYNLAWGAWVVLFPASLFAWLQAPQPNYLELWQCIGMIVGVYGIGYLIAATAPHRHWPIVLVGFLGKVFGPIGFAFALFRGTFPASFFWVIVFNDLVWLIPFGLILRQAARNKEGSPRALSLQEALEEKGPNGSLLDLSFRAPTLVVFLRHSGCCFFGSLLSKVFRHKRLFQAGQWNVVLFHMGKELYPEEKGIFWRSDSEQRFYRAFGLSKGTLWQVLGPQVWWQGLQAILKGNWVGPLEGDGFQMPGMFVVQNGQMVRAFRPVSLAEEFPVSDFLKGENSHNLKSVLLILVALLSFCATSLTAAPSLPARTTCAFAIVSTLFVSFPHATSYPQKETPPPTHYAPPFASGTADGPWVVYARENTPIVIEVFQKGWLSRAVAQRMKERLVQRCPDATKIANWNAAGLKVPIHTMEFVEDTTRGIRLRVKGTYFEMTSKEAIDLNALGAENAAALSFTQRIEDPDGQGAEIKVGLKIRPGALKDTWDVSDVVGTIGAFGPFFSHSEAFKGGPWTAVPAP